MKCSGLKAIALGLALIFAAHSASGAVVVLNPDNAFTDMLSGEASIVVAGFGPIRGNNAVFSCGTSESADFSDATSQIGGDGGGICDIVLNVPRTLINDDLPIVVKDLSTDLVHDIDLLSFRGSGNRCFDNDGGLSCEAAGGYTSYDRNVVPIPAAVWMFSAALAALGFVRRRAAA